MHRQKFFLHHPLQFDLTVCTSVSISESRGTETPRLMWNTQIHYRGHAKSPPQPALQMRWTQPTFSRKRLSILMLFPPCMHRSPKQYFQITPVFLCISDVLYSCYKTHHFIFFNLETQFVKVIIIAYGGGERGAQGFGGETWGKETNGETQTQMGW